MWKQSILRKSYSALLWLHFCNGLYLSVSSNVAFRNYNQLHWSGLCNIASVFVASIACHFVPHKIVLGITNFAKTASVGGMLMYLTEEEGQVEVKNRFCKCWLNTWGFLEFEFSRTIFVEWESYYDMFHSSPKSSAPNVPNREEDVAPQCVFRCNVCWKFYRSGTSPANS